MKALLIPVGVVALLSGCVGYVDHSLWGAAPVALLPSATLLCCDLLDAVIAVACPPTPHATA